MFRMVLVGWGWGVKKTFLFLILSSTIGGDVTSLTFLECRLMMTIKILNVHELLPQQGSPHEGLWAMLRHLVHISRAKEAITML